MSHLFEIVIEDVFDILGMQPQIVGTFKGSISAGNLIETKEGELIRVISVSMPGHQMEKVSLSLDLSLEKAKKLRGEILVKKPQYTREQSVIEVKAGHTFYIILEENPTTGYTWEQEVLDEEDESVFIEKEQFIRFSGSRVGSGGVNAWLFNAGECGTKKVLFTLGRPWDDESVDRLEFVFNVN